MLTLQAQMMSGAGRTNGAAPTRRSEAEEFLAKQKR